MDEHLSKRGTGTGIISCVFAGLSILLLVSSIAGSIYAHSIIESLKSASSGSILAALDFNEYTRATNLSWICLSSGVACMLITIICGHITQLRGRHTGNRSIRRLWIIGLVVGYGCLVPAAISITLAIWVALNFTGLHFSL